MRNGSGLLQRTVLNTVLVQAVQLGCHGVGPVVTQIRFQVRCGLYCCL